MNLFFDIETTMDHKKIRLLGYKLDSQPTYITSNPVSYKVQQDTALKMNPGSQLVTFNGEGFDIPVMKKVHHLPCVMPHLDLYIVSKLFFDRPSHSMDSWAKEMDPSFTKLSVDYDNADISELQTYLKRDLEILQNLYHYMMRKVDALRPSSWKHPYKVEQRVRQLMNEQRERGFHFDVAAATNAVYLMDKELARIERDTARYMPVAPIPKAQLRHPPKKQFKADGSVSLLMHRYIDSCGCLIVGNKGTYRAYNPEDNSYFSLPIHAPLKTESNILISETNRIKDYCLEQGWEPEWWNTNADGDRTSPQLVNRDSKEADPGLKKILNPALVDELSKYSTTKSRRTSIAPYSGTKSGLMNRAVPAKDGHVIHHDADSLGTPTSRMRHKGIVNIPRVSSLWGTEMRSLFIPPKGMVMVGWDASGLEAAMEAHYTYPFDSEYAKELVSGDIHTRNQTAIGLPTRDDAKKFKYMLMYGAKPKKIAQSMGVSVAQASIWYDAYWDANPALYRLIDYLEQEWKDLGSSYLKGLDGRLIPTRHKHALLNSKLQGAGAVVMKHSMLIAEKTIGQEMDIPVDAYALIRYHDEEQWAAIRPLADRVGELGVESIEKAGKYLKLNIPVTGEYKIGESWADTH